MLFRSQRQAARHCGDHVKEKDLRKEVKKSTGKDKIKWLEKLAANGDWKSIKKLRKPAPKQQGPTDWRAAADFWKEMDSVIEKAAPALPEDARSNPEWQPVPEGHAEGEGGGAGEGAPSHAEAHHGPEDRGLMAISDDDGLGAECPECDHGGGAGVRALGKEDPGAP